MGTLKRIRRRIRCEIILSIYTPMCMQNNSYPCTCSLYIHIFPFIAKNVLIEKECNDWAAQICVQHAHIRSPFQKWELISAFFKCTCVHLLTSNKGLQIKSLCWPCNAWPSTSPFCNISLSTQIIFSRLTCMQKHVQHMMHMYIIINYSYTWN
jgi:hypothetical protein